MAKIYPNSPISSSPLASISAESQPATLTVWRKSLLFNCSGFTVFDSKGNLSFRVDNYSSASRTEIVLMDAAGKPLYTIRRKKLSIADHWHIFDGDASASRPRFSVRKHVSLLPSKELAYMTTYGREEGIIYGIEGSFSHRACAVYDDRRRQVAEIRRKEPVAGVAFDGDVFRLIVQPGFDAGLSMTVVILLEQMFGSRVRDLKD
ncbi:protein LURP-one-related 8-like [Phalaenopsis equestris]|uniref:protein LURP-one-related 8-like n=1 Tax=Phalaenopsis equestris TaxID=78828 RepID=UPI0009E3A5E6|nr:protein LURP-one-related 8-like [Phalaenopsis equestris]